MILVTGAAGKTGQAVIRALTARGRACRALVRSEDQASIVRACGAQEVKVGDLREGHSLTQAAEGVRAVYHICPNVHPGEVEIGKAAMEAARSVGVDHFVYHSVLYPSVRAMPHHWRKAEVEESLFASGLAYTILQPASYMQNLLPGWETMIQRGVYSVPYSASTKLGMVDLEDVAEAAALVLSDPSHMGATYELAGREVLDQSEVASIISQKLGRQIKVEKIPIEEWTQKAEADGLEDAQVQSLVAMFRYYEEHGFWGNPRVLEGLLGRPATSFDQFVDRVVQER